MLMSFREDVTVAEQCQYHLSNTNKHITAYRTLMTTVNTSKHKAPDYNRTHSN